MAQLAENLSCRHKDLSLNLYTPHKKARCGGIFDCSLRAGKADIADPRGSLASQPWLCVGL